MRAFCFTRAVIILQIYAFTQVQHLISYSHYSISEQNMKFCNSSCSE